MGHQLPASIRIPVLATTVVADLVQQAATLAASFVVFVYSN
jgi:hypothetical protein